MALAAGTERFVQSDDAAVCAEAVGPWQGLEALGGGAYRMVEVVIGTQGMDDRIRVEQATSMRYHDAPLFEFIAVLSPLVIGRMYSARGHRWVVSRGWVGSGNVAERQVPA
jgi:hypothetical protein